MTRNLWLFTVVGLLLINVGCGTLCKRGPFCGKNDPTKKPIFVPPPAPAPLVPVGAIVPGPGAFPTSPPPAPSFGPPTAPFPTSPPPGAPGTPPSITPTPKDPSRSGTNWQPIEKSDAAGSPRIQLYAPETLEPATDKRPSVKGTFPPIAQFAEAKDKVYVGLRPTADGLDWLHTNRNALVVQVRLPGEDDAAVKKQVEDRGMRYVAVEVSPTTLTKEKADEFIKLIRENVPQSMFVFDADGSLAGAMWYLHLRWGEILDDDAAQLRARPLGLQNMRDGQHRDMWLAVQKLLSENNR